MRFIKAVYHASIKTAEYEASCGTRLLKTGGSLNWRFNNPGNLISVKNQPGKIGVGVVYNPEKHLFAIFSSIEVGEKAKKTLLKKKYSDYTIPDMMKKYAPGNDGNDPDAYARFILSESGVSKDEKVGDLDDTKFDKVLRAISKKEGGLKPGTEKWVYVTNVTVSDGSRPIADVPFKVTLGSTTYEWKTDNYGKLRTIVHTKQGMTIVIKYINSAGREDIVYSAVAGNETKNVLLTRNFSQFSAKTLTDEPKVPCKKSTQEPIEYIVMPGDTLSKIASRYKTSIDDIVQNNDIKDVSKIFPGQRLTLYGVNTSSPSIYVVSPGDTLVKIAEKNGVSVDEIVQQNNISDPNKIYPGQSISINKGNGAIVEHSEKSVANRVTSRQFNQNSQKKNEANTNKKTLESVRGKNSGNPIALLPHDQREAPWMAVAIREAKQWHGVGEKDIKDNYHHLINAKGSLSNTAWCASFINYCLKESSYDCSKNYPQSSQFPVYDKVKFVKVDKPVYGALMVFRTYTESENRFTGYGHISLVYGKTIHGDIAGLGGNQGGSRFGGGTIKLSSYSTTKVVSKFRMTVKGERSVPVYQKFFNFYIPVAYRNYAENNSSELMVVDVDDINHNLFGFDNKETSSQDEGGGR